MRPRKRTAEIEALLDDVARQKAAIPSYKQLEVRTGLRIQYLRQLISLKVQVISNKCDVSRETK